MTTSEAVFFGVMAVLTAISLLRELPLQYVMTILCITYAISALAHFVFHKPCWWLPLVVLNSRGVGRLLLFKWREGSHYGWWLIALTCVLSSILVLQWITPLLALIMQLAALPWLIKRRPAAEQPSYFPAINWLLLAILHFFNFSFLIFRH